MNIFTKIEKRRYGYSGTEQNGSISFHVTIQVLRVARRPHHRRVRPGVLTQRCFFCGIMKCTRTEHRHFFIAMKQNQSGRTFFNKTTFRLIVRWLSDLPATTRVSRYSGNSRHRHDPVNEWLLWQRAGDRRANQYIHCRPK
jgi:hypothetical protein